MALATTKVFLHVRPDGANDRTKHDAKKALRKLAGALTLALDEADVVVFHQGSEMVLENALGLKKPVVSPLWLTACRDAGRKLDTRPFEIVDGDSSAHVIRANASPTATPPRSKPPPAPRQPQQHQPPQQLVDEEDDDDDTAALLLGKSKAVKSAAAPAPQPTGPPTPPSSSKHATASQRAVEAPAAPAASKGKKATTAPPAEKKPKAKPAAKGQASTGEGDDGPAAAQPPKRLSSGGAYLADGEVDAEIACDIKKKAPPRKIAKAKAEKEKPAAEPKAPAAAPKRKKAAVAAAAPNVPGAAAPAASQPSAGTSGTAASDDATPPKRKRGRPPKNPPSPQQHQQPPAAAAGEPAKAPDADGSARKPAQPTAEGRSPGGKDATKSANATDDKHDKPPLDTVVKRQLAAAKARETRERNKRARQPIVVAGALLADGADGASDDDDVNAAVAGTRAGTNEEGVAFRIGAPTRVVLAISGVPGDERETLKHVAIGLGAVVVDEVFGRVAEKPTHLVAEGSNMSPKILLALSLGIPIVRPSWVYASLSSGRWLAVDGTDGDDKPFFVDNFDKAAFVERLSLLYRRDRRMLPDRPTRGPQFLQGITVWFAGFAEFPDNSVFAELLQTAGAEVVRLVADASLSVVVLMDESLVELQKTLGKESSSPPKGKRGPRRSGAAQLDWLRELAPNVPVVTSRWVVESIAACRAQPFDQFAAGFDRPNSAGTGAASPASPPMAPAPPPPAATTAATEGSSQPKRRGRPPKQAQAAVTADTTNDTTEAATIVPRKAHRRETPPTMQQDGDSSATKPQAASDEGRGSGRLSTGSGGNVPGTRLGRSPGTPIQAVALALALKKQSPGPASAVKQAAHQWSTQRLRQSLSPQRADDDDA